MAQASNRITHFPGNSEPQEPIAPLPEAVIDLGRDPTREIRTLIEDLQNTAREASRRQRQAEDEREQFRDRVLKLERELESQIASDSRFKALTRERDMLAEQQSQYGPVISDLNKRLKQTEAELLEASSQRDAAERDSKQTRRLIEDLERKKEEALRQKEAAIRQRDLAKEEQKKATEQAATAKKNFSDAQKALSEAKNELVSSKKKGGTEQGVQLASLRQARDGMAAQIKELKNRIAELEDQAAENSYAREAAEKAAKTSRAEIAELRKTLGEATANAGNAARAGELESELETLRADLDTITQERDERTTALEDSRTSLIETRKQLDEITIARDAFEKQLSDTETMLEEQIAEQSSEIERLKEMLAESEAKSHQSEELASQFEQRRLHVIELNAQLENAHREIRNLSACLAEARLQAKLNARNGNSENAHPQSGKPPASHESACREEILAMRRCFQAFSRDQKQFGMLNELETYALKIADESMENGHPILHRIAIAFTSLLADLLEVPEQITQSTLRTINQTIEFIALHIADPEIEGRIDLGQARVYVVDDDRNTCLTFVDAFNLVGLQTHFVNDSRSALEELAGKPCDLIILDVHMPDMSGFELCSHIRTMAPHVETPIFFVTGDASLENRVKSSLRGGNEFISKPFSIQEIALKALKTVVNSQLKGR